MQENEEGEKEEERSSPVTGIPTMNLAVFEMTRLLSHSQSIIIYNSSPSAEEGKCSALYSK